MLFKLPPRDVRVHKSHLVHGISAQVFNRLPSLLKLNPMLRPRDISPGDLRRKEAWIAIRKLLSGKVPPNNQIEHVSKLQWLENHFVCAAQARKLYFAFKNGHRIVSDEHARFRLAGHLESKDAADILIALLEPIDFVQMKLSQNISTGDSKRVVSNPEALGLLCASATKFLLASADGAWDEG